MAPEISPLAHCRCAGRKQVKMMSIMSHLQVDVELASEIGLCSASPLSTGLDATAKQRPHGPVFDVTNIANNNQIINKNFNGTLNSTLSAASIGSPGEIDDQSSGGFGSDDDDDPGGNLFPYSTKTPFGLLWNLPSADSALKQWSRQQLSPEDLQYYKDSRASE